MKALVWLGPRSMRMETQAKPDPRSVEVLIAVEAVGICGSELSGYLGHNSLRVPPLVMGHEFAGLVAAVGEGVTGFQIGQRVTVNPMVPCGYCRPCRSGAEQLCLNRRLIGAHRPGAFAEWVAVPAKAVYPLPTEMSAVDGALVEPLACGVRAVERGQVAPGSTVLVLGAGMIGLMCLVVARRGGAGEIVVVDTNDARLELARDWGATRVLNPRRDDVGAAVLAMTDGFGADVALDAVGLPATRQQAVRALAPGGRAVLIGLHEDETTLPGNHIVRQEIDVMGSFCYSYGNFNTALKLMAAGFLKPGDRWLRLAPLEQGQAWFDALVDTAVPEAKIVLTL